MNSYRWFLVGLVALFGTYVALEYYSPKPLDWRPTFINTDKIPYGTYVLYDQLPQLLGTDSVEAVRLPIYSQLTNERTFDELEEEEPIEARANYLFVNEKFQATPTDTRALLRFVAAGNDVFIAAEDFGDYQSFFRDTLGFHTALTTAKPLDVARSDRRDSATVRFTNPALHSVRYRLPAAQAQRYFVVDSGRVGHTLATDNQNHAVFISLDHGRGHFYLCSLPTAFSNYFLLQPRHSGFASAAFAYLPPRPVWWDEYQKQGRTGDQSVLRMLLNHDALRTAYYLLAITVLLFVLMGARRLQRIIPTIKPLPNTTLLFTSTVASLYQQGGNHARIAEKKAGLFLDFLRTRFQETTPDFSDEAFRERLSQKAGLPRTRIDELLRLINFVRTAPQVSDQQLLQMTQAISNFRRDSR